VAQEGKFNSEKLEPQLPGGWKKRTADDPEPVLEFEFSA
jgi:hypothetical protein